MVITIEMLKEQKFLEVVPKSTNKNVVRFKWAYDIK